MLLKKLQQIHNTKEAWFFDESRFGTHSNIGHAWFRKGQRTPVKIKLGYENFYLYSAVNSKTGDSFSLMLPKVNTLCMNIFMKEFGKYINNKDITFIMDGATWHKSRSLHIPSNIKSIIQPPYSPEVNPVERLWQYIKHNILRNRIYETLEELENIVCEFLQKLSPETIKSVCSYKYV